MAELAGWALGDGAAGAPVEAGGVPGHEGLVDQVPAQGAMVVEYGLEDLVDDGFWVLAAWLKRLRNLVEQQPSAAALGRNGGDPAIADEGPQLVRRVGEETVSVI